MQPRTTIAGLLAEPHRRAVFSAIVLGQTTVAGVCQLTGFGEAAVTKALDRMIANGLISTVESELRVVESRIHEEARVVQIRDPGVAIADDADSEEIRVLRTFFTDGRLTQYPAQAMKQKIVLDHLAQGFDPGVRYTEAHVNLILGQSHADTALLRRSLVDHEFLEREDRVYWRSGGSFPVRVP